MVPVVYVHGAHDESPTRPGPDRVLSFLTHPHSPHLHPAPPFEPLQLSRAEVQDAISSSRSRSLCTGISQSPFWLLSQFFLTYRDMGAVIVENSSMGFKKENETTARALAPLPKSDRQKATEAVQAADAQVRLPFVLVQ